MGAGSYKSQAAIAAHDEAKRRNAEAEQARIAAALRRARQKEEAERAARASRTEG